MVNESGEILELFSPQLNTEKTARFNSLVQRIACAFPNYRIQLVQNELNSFEADDNDIESVKYTAALNILIDLCQQGWQLEVHDSQLYLKMTAQSSIEKAHIRFRLSSERKAQFQEDSVQRFIE